MPLGLDSTGELRADEHSSPTSSAVKNSDVRPLKVDESDELVEIYIW